MVSSAVLVIRGFGLCLFAAAVGHAADAEGFQRVEDAQVFDVLDADPAEAAKRIVCAVGAPTTAGGYGNPRTAGHLRNGNSTIDVINPGNWHNVLASYSNLNRRRNSRIIYPVDRHNILT